METVLRRVGGVLPAEPGVYRFRDAAGRVIYVGRATDLRARVRSYAGDLADRPHLRRMIPQVVRVEALACASVHEAAWLERNLLDRSLPRWNRVRGGAELVGWLTMDDGPARPGLTLVVEPDARPTSGFGPYLGVERLELARTGLLRAWPLHLTGARLDRADASLAEVRGVTPAERDRCAAAIRAVLGRDPGAVAELGERLDAARAAAVTRLAFEAAARVQAERAAVEWLVAPQRVTGCADGLVVAGWADGFGVTLRADGDRLDRWTSGPVDAGPGRAASERTPDPWRAFAQRNAELGAALAAAAD